MVCSNKFSGRSCPIQPCRYDHLESSTSCYSCSREAPFREVAGGSIVFLSSMFLLIPLHTYYAIALLSYLTGSAVRCAGFGPRLAKIYTSTSTSQRCPTTHRPRHTESHAIPSVYAGCKSAICTRMPQRVMLKANTGGATENKEDKNFYKQVIRLLKN
jgi:hypothetical protein